MSYRFVSILVYTAILVGPVPANLSLQVGNTTCQATNTQLSVKCRHVGGAALLCVQQKFKKLTGPDTSLSKHAQQRHTQSDVYAFDKSSLIDVSHGAAWLRHKKSIELLI